MAIVYSQCLPGAGPTTAPTTAPTTTKPTTTVPGPTTTTTGGATPTGSQIRTVQDPVYHFYLQNSGTSVLLGLGEIFYLSVLLAGGTPVLGPEASSGRFTLGSTISLNNANGSKLYLNIDNSGTQSYKSLAFGSTATTTNWGLEGDTIITTSPRQLNFIACPSSTSTIYNVYLQQGNDTPAGKTCTLVTLHLPCLC